MKIGIIGGGQLAMFLCDAANKRNIETYVLDPNPSCSAKRTCTNLIVGAYDDQQLLQALFMNCDYVTYEFENIDLMSLAKNDQTKLVPPINSLTIGRDRFLEKATALSCGLNVGAFQTVDSIDDIKSFLNKYPKAVVKTRSFGYDGKGQLIVTENNYQDSLELLTTDCIIEQFIEFDYEVSIIGCRTKSGEFQTVSYNRNYHRNHILERSEIIECNFLDEQLKTFMMLNNLYGILTIEFFVKDNQFYFNEIAPRPHNSGHSSIEGCSHSQYDLALSAILNEHLPIVTHEKYVMFNVLGQHYYQIKDLITNGIINLSDNTVFHDYHKPEVITNRKMAHITSNDDDLILFLNNYFKEFNE